MNKTTAKCTTKGSRKIVMWSLHAVLILMFLKAVARA